MPSNSLEKPLSFTRLQVDQTFLRNLYRDRPFIRGFYGQLSFCIAVVPQQHPEQPLEEIVCAIRPGS